MPTARCKCGEEIHYSPDKAGLIARCRCGRPVRLPEPVPEPAPKSVTDYLDDADRAASKRRQVIALLAVAVVVAMIVMLFARLNPVSRAQPQQQVAPADGER